MFPLAIPFPNISPEIFSFEFNGYDFALRWYALGYIIGILIGIRIAKKIISSASLWLPLRPVMTHDQVDTIAIFIIFGVIVGGRLGFVFFYEPEYYLANPSEIVKMWNGGMSFHGGLIGVALAILFYAVLARLPLLSTGDLIALTVTPGIFLVRITNFINAELWGHPTSMPWGVIFPGALAQACPEVIGACARHPSQLYEALFEGFALGILLWICFRRGWLKRPGTIMGLFFVGYAVARFNIEFFRVADTKFITHDNPFGYVFLFNQSALGLTMGQVLTIPIFIIGVLFMANAIPAYQRYTAPLGRILSIVGIPFVIFIRSIDIVMQKSKIILIWVFKGLKFIVKLPWFFEKK